MSSLGQLRRVAAGLALFGAAGTASALNLIVDGSFEALTVSPGSYSNYTSVGSPLESGSPWIMGGGTSLNGVSTTYTESPLVFTAQDGVKSLDLTGTGNTGGNSVYQTITTVPLQQYLLTFYVGAAFDIGPYDPPSTVALTVGGVSAGNFQSSPVTTNAITWTQASYLFTASTTSTMISFANATPSGNNLAGLDNVSVSPVPEAAEWAMMLSGLGVVAFVARRRARRNAA